MLRCLTTSKTVIPGLSSQHMVSMVCMVSYAASIAEHEISRAASAPGTMSRARVKRSTKPCKPCKPCSSVSRDALCVAACWSIPHVSHRKQIRNLGVREATDRACHKENVNGKA
jgi:hypothetical protein